MNPDPLEKMIDSFELWKKNPLHRLPTYFLVGLFSYVFIPADLFYFFFYISGSLICAILLDTLIFYKAFAKFKNKWE